MRGLVAYRGGVIEIPRNRLEIRFARSGGPGGQNVNKVETKAEVRFHVDGAEWIPAGARKRLHVLQASRINRKGELVISSSRFRSQAQNLEDCISRLRRYLHEASKVPQKRLPTRPGKAARERRLRLKRRRRERKEQRRLRAEAL